MKLILISMILWSFLAIAEESFKSLSCSRSGTGTQLYYINGIMNNDGQAKESAKAIREAIVGSNYKNNIDSLGNVFTDYIYNNSEEAGLDFIQTTAQKILETGEIPLSSLSVAFYIFKKASFCTLNPVSCAAIGVGVGGLLLKQAYISQEDQRQMVDLIKFHLDNHYKVIVVTHSQGNLVINSVYEGLLRKGVSKETLDRFYGNLQVGSAASSIKAKNGKLYLSKQDKVIKSLRINFPSTQQGNFDFVGDRPESQDFANHGFVESYLSDDVNTRGPKQGKGIVARTASRVFLDTLEEVAWMLANNDPNCCDGRDGRFYRADYNSEPGGFVEESVVTDTKFLTVSKESQICGNVKINNSSSVVELLGESEIHSFYPISIEGKVSLVNTIMTNYSHEAGASYKGTKIGHGIEILNSYFHEGVRLEGDLIVGDTTTFGSPVILANQAYEEEYDYFRVPLISGVTFEGEATDISGFFFLKNFTGNDIKVSGDFKQTPGQSSGYLVIDPNYSHNYTKATFNGIGLIKSRVDENVVINGYPVQGYNHGVSLTTGTHISDSARLSGSLYIQDSAYSGTWIGSDLFGIEDNVSNAFNSQVFTTNVSGAPAIHGSQIVNSSISGKSTVISSSLDTCSVSCDAWVRESAFEKSMGCGYSSALGGSLDAVSLLEKAKAEADQNYFDTIEHYKDIRMSLLSSHE